jgi:hypothetical protein
MNPIYIEIEKFPDAIILPSNKSRAKQSLGSLLEIFMLNASIKGLLFLGAQLGEEWLKRNYLRALAN